MNIFKSLFGGSDSKEHDNETNDNKNFEILKYDGIRALHLNKLKYALRCFEQALEIKDDAETMGYLANAYINDNNLTGAASTLEKLTSIKSDDIPSLLSLASVHYMQEDYQKMNDACTKALAIDENSIAAMYLNAKAFIGLKNDIMAIAMLTKAIVQKEDYADAYLLRATTLFSMNQIKDAKEDIEHVLGISPDDESALLLEAEIMIAEGKSEDAIKSLDNVLSVNPFNEKTYLLKAGIYTQEKNLDKAIEVYDEAIEINPQFAKAFHERGRVKLIKGDKDGSVEDMKKAMELAPDSEEKINGEYNNYDNITKNVPW